MTLAGQATQMPGLFGFDFDSTTNTLRTVLEGSWTLAIAHRYVAAFNEEAARLRHHDKSLRLLMDARRMQICPVEVARTINTNLVYERSDRLAIVLDTVLAKVATRRYMAELWAAFDWEVFMSTDAAETWLQA